jgi:hypothetical protein
MNSFNPRKHLRQIEKLILSILGRDSGLIHHVRKCQTRAETPVVVRVELIGTSLVMRVFATEAGEHAPSLAARKIEPMHSDGKMVYWLAINGKDEFYVVDAPELSNLPMKANPMLTCFHPLEANPYTEDAEIRHDEPQLEMAL